MKIEGCILTRIEKSKFGLTLPTYSVIKGPPVVEFSKTLIVSLRDNFWKKIATHMTSI